MGLTQGDTIVTGIDGKVTVDMDGNKEMIIAENTRIMIGELVQSIQDNADKTSFNLKAGKVFCNIKEKLTPGSKYEIRTPTAVMGVRGTMFFVGQEDGRTDIAVLDGTVVATSYVPPQQSPGGQPPGLQQIETILQPNQQIILDPTGFSPEGVQIQQITQQSLDIFVLESIRDNPQGINQNLLLNIDQIIQQIQQEQEHQRQQQQQQQQQQQPPAIVYDEISNTGNNTNTDSGDDSDNSMPTINLVAIADGSVTVGQTITKDITVSPADATITYAASPTGLVNLTGSNPLSVTGVQAGTATVTVTATKSGYQSSARTFTVVVNNPGTVAIPTANVPGGSYSTAQSVTLSTTTAGATIFYTTDGSNPKEASAPFQYTGTPVAVSSTTTINAYAKKEGMVDSAVATFVYTITSSGPPQFVSATAISPSAIEIVFDQNIFFVNDDPYVFLAGFSYGGEDIWVSLNYDSAEIVGKKLYYIYGGGGDGMKIPCDFTGNLSIAAGVVRNAAAMTNPEVIQQPIADGLGPRLGNHNAAAIIAEDTIELRFPETVAYAVSEADFISKLTIPGLSLSESSVSGSTVTITLAAPLSDLTYTTSNLSIAAGALKDSFNNLSPEMANIELDNWLPPYLVSNATYGTINGLSPANGSMGVDVNANLILTFDRSLDINFDQNVEIRKVADGSLFQSINLWDCGWPDNEIIILNPNTFNPSTGYYVVVPSNAFGIYSNSEVFFPGTNQNNWSFITGTIEH
jgi:hypothetical protein